MISNKEISITKQELKEIFDKDVKENIEQSSKILDIRESLQYSTKTRLEIHEFKFLKERTKALFDKLRKEAENSL